jgi:O-antigen/teichoic acid export membrane protein
METFMKVWGPFIFEAAKRDEGPVQIATVFKVFASCTAWAALAISVVAPAAVRLVAGKQFVTAYTLVPVLALASIFYSLQIVADCGILITKRTHFKPLTFGVGALVAVTLGYFATKHFGARGAAWSVVASNMAVFSVTFAISNRLYPLPIRVSHLVRIVAPAAAIVAAFYAFQCDVAYLPIQFAAAAAAVGLYPLAVIVLKVFSLDERRQARELFEAIRYRLSGTAADSSN